jgi:hypothetical protein
MILPLTVAMDLNEEMPMDGLKPVLLAARRESGPDVMVMICSDCETVQVLL